MLICTYLHSAHWSAMRMSCNTVSAEVLGSLHSDRTAPMNDPTQQPLDQLRFGIQFLNRACHDVQLDGLLAEIGRHIKMWKTQQITSVLLTPVQWTNDTWWSTNTWWWTTNEWSTAVYQFHLCKFLCSCVGWFSTVRPYGGVLLQRAHCASCFSISSRRASHSGHQLALLAVGSQLKPYKSWILCWFSLLQQQIDWLMPVPRPFSPFVGLSHGRYYLQTEMLSLRQGGIYGVFFVENMSVVGWALKNVF